MFRRFGTVLRRICTAFSGVGMMLREEKTMFRVVGTTS